MQYRMHLGTETKLWEHSGLVEFQDMRNDGKTADLVFFLSHTPCTTLTKG